MHCRSSPSKKNLLSFKEIRCKSYHIETIEKMRQNIFILYLLSQMNVYQKSCLLYHRVVETYATMNLKFMNPDIFTTWHNRLGHLESIMMRRIIENSHAHPLMNQHIIQSNEISCDACCQDKLIIILSPAKVEIKSPTFFERIQCDICGSINPPSRPFKYFVVLIDASNR